MRMTGNTILITGGGTGIGRALAERLHALGNRVIIAGRRQEALDAVAAANPGMRTTTLDVADPAAIDRVRTELERDAPELNVLINNAGMAAGEDWTGGAPDPAVAEATVATNLLGPIRLTAALLPRLQAAEGAAVVNVSSGLAFVPLVAWPTYSATKAALHSWSVSLREQLAGSVEVIEIAPPAVRTELTPGQSANPEYLPLEAYADEVMELWSADPTPREVLVERVGFLRHAEREGRFDEALRVVNGL